MKRSARGGTSPARGREGAGRGAPSGVAAPASRTRPRREHAPRATTASAAAGGAAGRTRGRRRDSAPGAMAVIVARRAPADASAARRAAADRRSPAGAAARHDERGHAREPSAPKDVAPPARPAGAALQLAEVSDSLASDDGVDSAPSSSEGRPAVASGELAIRPLIAPQSTGTATVAGTGRSARPARTAPTETWSTSLFRWSAPSTMHASPVAIGSSIGSAEPTACSSRGSAWVRRDRHLEGRRGDARAPGTA